MILFSILARNKFIMSDQQIIFSMNRVKGFPNNKQVLKGINLSFMGLKLVSLV